MEKPGQLFAIIFEPLIANIGLLAILAWLIFFYGQHFIQPAKIFSIRKTLAIGIMFGAVSALTQLFPAEFMPGLFIDTRGVPLIFSAIIGGPAAAIVATIISAYTRYLLGGMGLVPGIVFSSVFCAGGIVAAYVLKRKNSTLPSMKFSIFMALITSLFAMIATLFLPQDIRLKVIFNLWPSLTLANVIGTVVFTRLLQQIHLQKKYLDTLEVKNEQQLKEILKKQNHLDILNKYSPGAIAMFDNDMHYILVSNAWLKAYGREGKNIIGMSHYDDFPEIPDKWKTVHQRALAGENLKSEQDVFYREDGTIQWIRWEVRPWYDNHHAIGGIIIFSEDLTELKKLEQEKVLHFKHAKETAEIANLNKSQFLSNMSHELRTPMHAINSFSSIGQKKTSDEKAKDYFSKIHASGLRLTRLLDDLLDLSKLEAGKQSIDFKVHDICQTINLVATDISSLLNDKNIHLQLPICEFCQCTYDEKLMQRVLMNLLSNAIKFSPPGSSIEIKKEMIDAEQVLRLSVIDHGVGIPAKELDEIFDSFVQSSKTKTQAGGTGLGLAITREIIELHHGKIWVESPLPDHEQGAVFTFQIPLQQS